MWKWRRQSARRSSRHGIERTSRLTRQVGEWRVEATLPPLASRGPVLSREASAARDTPPLSAGLKRASLVAPIHMRNHRSTRSQPPLLRHLPSAPCRRRAGFAGGAHPQVEPRLPPAAKARVGGGLGVGPKRRRADGAGAPLLLRRVSRKRTTIRNSQPRPPPSHATSNPTHMTKPLPIPPTRQTPATAASAEVAIYGAASG